MSASETNITLNMSKKEKALIQERAENLGMTVSRYIKSLIKSDRRRAQRGKKKAQTVDYEEEVIPTWGVDLLLTEEEWDKLNELAIQSEMNRNAVLREFIRTGSIITLPFQEREEEIRDLTAAVSLLIQKTDSLMVHAQRDGYDISGLQEELKTFNLNCRNLLQKELMSQQKLASAIRKVLRSKKVR